VGDVAHLNSPIVAMGMNSGIHDAVNLAANLLRVLNGEEDEGALERYVRQRRHVAVEHVRPRPSQTKRTWSSAIRTRGSNIARR
jgi:3-(3-hydroxy-phenyl)propionate hydroxylase